MNILLQIILSVGLAIGGMLFVAWYNGWTAPDTGEPDVSKFWEDNKRPFLWSIVGVILIISLVTFVPDVAAGIKTITGFEITVPVSNGAAVFMGIMIYDQVRKRFKLTKDEREKREREKRDAIPPTTDS